MDKHVVHVYNERWLSIKNETSPSAATQMALGGTVFSEISQTNTVCYHLYVESKKYNKLINITKMKETNRTN